MALDRVVSAQGETTDEPRHHNETVRLLPRLLRLASSWAAQGMLVCRLRQDVCFLSWSYLMSWMRRRTWAIHPITAALYHNGSLGISSTYHGSQNDYQNNSKIILICNRTNKKLPGRKSCSGLVTGNFENSKLVEGLVILKKKPDNHNRISLLFSFILSLLFSSSSSFILSFVLSLVFHLLSRLSASVHFVRLSVSVCCVCVVCVLCVCRVCVLCVLCVCCVCVVDSRLLMKLLGSIQTEGHCGGSQP